MKTIKQAVADGEFGPNPLTNLEETIRQHWAEFRPKMYEQLALAGALNAAINAAAALTREAVLNAVAHEHLGLQEAWELYKGEHAILPSEEVLPELGTDPAQWQVPEIEEDEDTPPAAPTKSEAE